MRPKLKRLTINGFRSIRQTALDLRDLNVMIGPNGAGKSTIVACFRLLNEMMGRRLQQYLHATGRAESNLHYGPEQVPQMELQLHFEVENGTDTYVLKLARVAGDTMMFSEETLIFHQTGYPSPKVVELGGGHPETRVGQKAEEGDITAKTIRYLLNRCRVFNFHDMSPGARVRQRSFAGDNRWIMPDAANLPAVLFRLRRERPPVYERIVTQVRRLAPFFDDFELTPSESRDIHLNWRHRDSGTVFGPRQFSDGTLRAICLVSLLLQPHDSMPLVMVLDEPEMGLHPQALDVVAALFRQARQNTQIIAATHSATFLDSFGPEDVLIVERRDGATTFRRPGDDALDAWVDEYSMGEEAEADYEGP